MRKVIIGPTGPGIRTVNLATGPSGATGLWEQCGYTGHGPTGKYETVQIAAVRDHRFKSLACAGYTGTVTADSGGGGGGLPAWLPANAVAFADFQNGHYYSGGVVVTDPSTLFAAISNVGTTFDPANISASGLLNDEPSFIGTFLSDLLDPTGFTLLLDFDSGSNPNCRFGLETGDSSNYNHELDGIAGSDATQSYLYNDSDQLNASDNQITSGGTHNKIALTMTPSAMAISVNGGTPFTATPATPDSYPAIAIANTAFGGGVTYTRSLTIYRLLDNADLPALSSL